MKISFKMSYTPTYISKHTKAVFTFTTLAEARWVRSLFTGKGKIVARQPSPATCRDHQRWLTSGQHGSLWSAKVTTITTRCDRYSPSATDIKQGLHTSRYLLISNTSPLPFLHFTVTQRKMSKSRATGYLIISALVLSKHPIAACLVAFTLTRYYRTHFMALTSSCDTLSVETIIKVNEKHQNAPIVNPIYHAA